MLPVFVQAPWVHIYPFSALLFSVVIFSVGFCMVQFLPERFLYIGSLLVGVSGSWLGGCLFWGWLRSNPVWHLPIESIALPFACFGLNSRWKIGSSFYLASLLGTAFTDLMIVLTGVMKSWPEVVNASFQRAPELLNKAALDLLDTSNILLLFTAGSLIIFIAYWMNKKASNTSPFASSWLVASAALITTLWVDGLFFLTTLIQPQLSGLI